jgi:hypothetical protein
MNPVPFPDHGRVNDPLWQHLWATYSDVITPLRAAGLVTDMETCGGENHIRVELGDGTFLTIAGRDALPVDRYAAETGDDAELNGWSVMRLHEENPDYFARIYDSTDDGPAEANGTAVTPMLTAIAQHLAGSKHPNIHAAGQALGGPSAIPLPHMIARHLGHATARTAAAVYAPAPAQQRYHLHRFEFSAQHVGALGGVDEGPYDSLTEAVEQYARHTHELQSDGWLRLHRQGGIQIPLTVWAREGRVHVAYVRASSS